MLFFLTAYSLVLSIAIDSEIQNSNEYASQSYMCHMDEGNQIIQDLSHVYVTGRSEQVLKLTCITQKQCLPLLDILVNAECANTEMVEYWQKIFVKLKKNFSNVNIGN